MNDKDRWGYRSTMFLPKLLIKIRGEKKELCNPQYEVGDFVSAKEAAYKFAAGQMDNGIVLRAIVVDTRTGYEVWRSNHRAIGGIYWDSGMVACSCVGYETYVTNMGFKHTPYCQMAMVELAHYVYNNSPLVKFDRLEDMRCRHILERWWAMFLQTIERGEHPFSKKGMALVVRIPVILEVLKETGWDPPGHLVQSYKPPEG